MQVLVPCICLHILISSAPFMMCALPHMRHHAYAAPWTSTSLVRAYMHGHMHCKHQCHVCLPASVSCMPACLACLSCMPVLHACLACMPVLTSSALLVLCPMGPRQCHTPSRVVGLMCTSSKLITTSGLVTETGLNCPEGGWSPTSPEPPGQVALESTSESPPRAGYALLCMMIYDRKRYAFLIHGVLIAPHSRLIPRAANIYHRTMRPRPVLSALKLHPCEFTTASASAASAKEPTTRHTDPLSHTDTRWTRWPSYD